MIYAWILVIGIAGIGAYWSWSGEREMRRTAVHGRICAMCHKQRVPRPWEHICSECIEKISD